MSVELFDFSVFPVLTTQRLILRDIYLEDAADALIFRGDPYVQRFNSEPMTTVNEAAELIEYLRQGYEAHERICWGITLQGDDRVIGLCGFNSWSRHHHRADIGYDLARSHWGGGIASEAVRAMIAFGFDRMALHRIEAETIEDNHESVKMLEKIGFVREGTRREYSWEDDGRYHGGAIYGLLKHEYSRDDGRMK